MFPPDDPAVLSCHAAYSKVFILSWLFSFSTCIPRVLKISGIAKAPAVFLQKKPTCLTLTCCWCTAFPAGCMPGCFPREFPQGLKCCGVLGSEELPALHLQREGAVLCSGRVPHGSSFLPAHPGRCTARGAGGARQRCRLPTGIYSTLSWESCDSWQGWETVS